jgi:hypothetical protein
MHWAKLLQDEDKTTGCPSSMASIHQEPDIDGAASGFVLLAPKPEFAAQSFSDRSLLNAC